jgi:YHS domain-containing protein
MCKVMAVIMGVLILTAGLAFAGQTSAVEQAAVQPIEVGNKHCPVSGNEIGAMGPAFKYQYKGKIYNLCCGGCPQTFNTAPDKYAKIAEDEAASQNK